jgi:hypothetical protein
MEEIQWQYDASRSRLFLKCTMHTNSNSARLLEALFPGCCAQRFSVPVHDEKEAQEAQDDVFCFVERLLQSDCSIDEFLNWYYKCPWLLQKTGERKTLEPLLSAWLNPQASGGVGAQPPHSLEGMHFEWKQDEFVVTSKDPEIKRLLKSVVGHGRRCPHPKQASLWVNTLLARNRASGELSPSVFRDATGEALDEKNAELQAWLNGKGFKKGSYKTDPRVTLVVKRLAKKKGAFGALRGSVTLKDTGKSVLVVKLKSVIPKVFGMQAKHLAQTASHYVGNKFGLLGCTFGDWLMLPENAARFPDPSKFYVHHQGPWVTQEGYRLFFASLSEIYKAAKTMARLRVYPSQALVDKYFDEFFLGAAPPDPASEDASDEKESGGSAPRKTPPKQNNKKYRFAPYVLRGQPLSHLDQWARAFNNRFIH